MSDQDPDNSELNNTDEQPPSKKRKVNSKNIKNFIDDRAVESGEESSDHDDDDDENNSDDDRSYERDGFVVGSDEEEEEERKRRKKKKKSGDLEDSDSDDESDESDDHDESGGGSSGDEEEESGNKEESSTKKKKKKRFQRIRKKRAMEELDEDDLKLIQEEQRLSRQEEEEEEARRRQNIVARDATELQQQLFDAESEDEGIGKKSRKPTSNRFQSTTDLFDEDNLDDFIEDDIGAGVDYDEEAGMRGGGGMVDYGPSELQLNEANEIFGLGYADFLKQEDDEDKKSDDDFSEEEDGETSDVEEMEARRKHKLKKKMEKEAAALKKRKALLQKTFEPIQLVENFFTEKDELIRNADLPERYFDIQNKWFVVQEGDQLIQGGTNLVNLAWNDEDRVQYIIDNVEVIKNAYNDEEMNNESMESLDADRMNNKIYSSVAYSLKYMVEFEVPFLRMYRKDYITAEAVRDNLYQVLEQNTAYNKFLTLQFRIRQTLDTNDSPDASSNSEVNLVELQQEEAALLHELKTVTDSLTSSNKDDEDEDSDQELFGEEETDPRANEIRKKLSELQAKISSLRVSMPLDLPYYSQALRRAQNLQQLQDLSLCLSLQLSSKSTQKSKILSYYRTCVGLNAKGTAYQFMLSVKDYGKALQKVADRSTLGDLSNSVESPEFCEAIKDTFNLPQPPMGVDEHIQALIHSGALLEHTDPSGAQLSPLVPVRYIAATDLALDPVVKEIIRRILTPELRISCEMTVKAKKSDASDALSPFYDLIYTSTPAMLLMEHPTLPKQQNMNSYDGNYRSDTAANEAKLWFLRALHAQKIGYLKVNIDLTDGAQDYAKDFLNSVYKILSVDVEGNIDDGWSGQREQIISQALAQTVASLKVESLKESITLTKEYGLHLASSKLMQHANTAPYRSLNQRSVPPCLEPTTISDTVGVVVDPNSSVLYFVHVDPLGNLKDKCVLPRGIPAGAGYSAPPPPLPLALFLLKSRPSAIFIGCGGGMVSRALEKKLTEVVNTCKGYMKTFEEANEHMDEEDPEEMIQSDSARFTGNIENDIAIATLLYDEEGAKWRDCEVKLLDDSISNLFGNSVRGKTEFPDLTPWLRMAISLARLSQSPIAELCYAFSVTSSTGTFGTELLYLHLVEYQSVLNQSALLKAYERVLSDVVSSIGLHLNDIIGAPHLYPQLCFVPGLGPRKAMNLKQSMEQQGVGALTSRKQLLSKRLMGPSVYNNAVAFIRCDFENSHPLDDSRLHPDIYIRNKWAVKIAIDALDMNDRDAEEEELQMSAIQSVMVNSKDEVKRLLELYQSEYRAAYNQEFDVINFAPMVLPTERWNDKVNELDLETFSKLLEDDGYGKWLSHLNMAIWEFRIPFADPRTPLTLPIPTDKLFSLLTRENDYTLRPGKEVTGKVLSHVDAGARIRLDGDVTGFLPRRNMGDDIESMEDLIPEGTVISAVVMEVKKDHLTVDLSVRMEDLKKPPSEWPRPSSLAPLNSSGFDYESAKRDEDSKAEEREARLSSLIGKLNLNKNKPQAAATLKMMLKPQKGRVIRRACAHPAFRNASNDDVEKELKESGDLMVGEALLRPSHRAVDALALHWLVRKDCTKVIEVLEEDKQTEVSIGSKLKIKNEVYGSIDELLGRYIAPMNDRIEELLHHRKFENSSESEIDHKLLDLKRRSPAGVFYFLCWNEDHPGYASLRFILNKTPRHFPIGITPEGFMWFRNVYTHLDKLLNDFKKNPRGPSSSRSAGGGTGAFTGRSGAKEKQSRWGASVTNTTKPSVGWAAGSSIAGPDQAEPPAWTATSAASVQAQPTAGWPSAPSVPGNNTTAPWNQQQPPPYDRSFPPPMDFPPAPAQ